MKGLGEMSHDEADADALVPVWDYLDTVDGVKLDAESILEGYGKACTYSSGYVKRQEIFSCLTCSPDGNVGVCQCCSLVCHDGHEVLELCTKRNFRCDCGNSKCGELFCKLLASKDVENSDNLYNHNFKGNYCTCDQPYPDPNVEEHIEMIQCCICEDWFHEEHIGLQSGDKITRDEDGWHLFEDFVCQGCTTVYSFLIYYPQIISTSDTSDAMKEIDDENCSFDSSFNNTNSYSSPAEADVEGVVEECSEFASPTTTCVIGGMIDSLPTTKNSKPLFLSKGWRDCLCRCGKCSDFYSERGISFLLDKEDSIAEYERMADQKWEENMLKLKYKQWTEMGLVQKMEELRVIGDLKNATFSLSSQVSSDPSKPITNADIKKIVEIVTRRRMRPLAHLHNCRSSAGF